MNSQNYQVFFMEKSFLNNKIWGRKDRFAPDCEEPYKMPNSLVYSKQLGPRGYQKHTKHVSGWGQCYRKALVTRR